MNAGRLKYIITIQRPTIKQNDYGANGLDWKDYITTRADIQSVNGERVKENNEIVFAYTKTFTIRIFHDIDEKDRILYDGKKYRILSIDKDRDKQLIAINTELVNE